MKAVLLTGAGIAVVDGIVLGVSLGVGATGVAATALAVGLVAAVVLAWLTPDAPVVERATVTLDVHPAPASAVADEETDEETAGTAAAGGASPAPQTPAQPQTPQPQTSERPDAEPALTPLAA